MLTALSIGKGGLGRLANQMFTIAGVIGIACKSGQPFAFSPWKTYDNALFGQPVDDMRDYFTNPLPELPVNVSFVPYGYFWEYRDIKLPHGDWSIDAHMQDPRYFSDYMPLIRHYFRMKDEIDLSDYVALHIRCGDYIDNPDSYHPVCDESYYQEALDNLKGGGIFSGPTASKKLLVFTDGTDEQIKERVRFFDYEIFRGDYLESFRAMKCCHSFITANSSFSMMAAILGEHPEKKIISPRRWFGTQAGDMKFEGYPEGAIIL